MLESTIGLQTSVDSKDCGIDCGIDDDIDDVVVVVVIDEDDDAKLDRNDFNTRRCFDAMALRSFCILSVSALSSATCLSRSHRVSCNSWCSSFTIESMMEISNDDCSFTS